MNISTFFSCQSIQTRKSYKYLCSKSNTKTRASYRCIDAYLCTHRCTWRTAVSELSYEVRSVAHYCFISVLFGCNITYFHVDIPVQMWINTESICMLHVADRRRPQRQQCSLLESEYLYIGPMISPEIWHCDSRESSHSTDRRSNQGILTACSRAAAGARRLESLTQCCDTVVIGCRPQEQQTFISRTVSDKRQLRC